MIKIQINNLHQCVQEYNNRITGLVAARVSVLKKSLSHLNGEVVNFDNNDFVSFKAVSEKVIKIVDPQFKMPNGRAGYINAITQYRANPNGLININIVGLLECCRYLLDNGNEQLSNLLLCDASLLFNLNLSILQNFNIDTQLNQDVVKLAFNYATYNEDIGVPIREFFREKNIANICSYCNIESVVHQTNGVGENIRSCELDHFYDKSRYPLLSYSFFNLIPCDHTCNVTNKGGVIFTDAEHLNPHFMGYADKISFVPVGLTTSYTVSKIDLKILEVPGTAMYRKINGNNQPSEERGAQGNLNVFKIRSKYVDRSHRASQMLKTLHKRNKHFRHIQKYISTLNKLDLKANYISWYEEELDVRFNPADFNDKAFSKFARDIHDYYFTMNKTFFNKYILELIEN